MDRRRFLTGSAGALGQVFSAKGFAAFGPTGPGARPVRIGLDATRRLGAMPAEFSGLGYEISSVARPGLFSSSNRVSLRLVRNLGTRGVIRVGGNTSDYASFQADGKLISTPKGSAINQASLEDLGRFLDSAGWKLIWGLNLGSGGEQQAVEEAQTVAGIAKERLLAFEIGNEPDLFAHEGHRPAGYNYEKYLAEYRRYKAAIRARLPGAPFAGPDAARDSDWVTRFAKDEGGDLKLLTHHYYRGGAANPKSSLDELLQPDPGLEAMLSKMKQASDEARIPYRICETNSFSGGGKPGVSDTFGSALWMLDYMFTLAWGGASGVNIETGINQLDFVSSYSPIADDLHGGYSASPDYYGMLAFAQASRGERLSVDCDPNGVNLKAYAVAQEGNRLALTIINKDVTHPALVEVELKQRFTRGRAMRLTAPSIKSKQGVRLGGSAVAASGAWLAARTEPVACTSGRCSLAVPAGSAALIRLEGHPSSG